MKCITEILFESRELLKFTDFLPISNDEAKHFIESESPGIWEKDFNFGNDWKDFNDTDKSPYYKIIINQQCVGVISYDTYFNAFDGLEFQPLGPTQLNGRHNGKKSLWIKYLNIFSRHSIEQIAAIMEKLVCIAKQMKMKAMYTAAKNQRVKQLYLRGGWQLLEPDDPNSLYLHFIIED